MSSFSNLELSIIAVLLSIFAVYLHVPINGLKIPVWLRQLGKHGGPSTVSGPGVSKDFVQLMNESGKKVVIFYGSQTGTAEEYAARLAKEIKARYGLSSLVCNPEDYEFNVLDLVPSSSLSIFILATYGEGEPTDNAVSLVDFLSSPSPDFSSGTALLSSLNYLIFGLGNSTYENFCATSRLVDSRLQKFQARRIGLVGEGDDDNSLEEDYLAWKDGIWMAIENELGWVKGRATTVPDFEVKELSVGKGISEIEVYYGELSKQSLANKRGIHDPKNPFIAPILQTRELFQGGDRNCVAMEFDIRGSGMKYTTGDHVGIWPMNSDAEVERFLGVLNLHGKKDQVIEVISLDPELAKVPTPSPTTFEAVLRYYLDISQLASRQTIHSFVSFAPSEKARAALERLGTDRDAYHDEVAMKGLRLSEVLLLAAGASITEARNDAGYAFTTWNVPFSHILSVIPRLQPRYYSISSSSRLHPEEIHITAVVAKSQPSHESKLIHGLGTNYLLDLKNTVIGNNRSDTRGREGGMVDESEAPRYEIDGPRGKYCREMIYSVPIHIRTSKFRLTKSVKIPIIMIGPGTGVAPYRAFVQDRIFLARRARASKGPHALKDWAPMYLFYGCRRSDEDFLYKEEWAEYEKELDGVLRLRVAFSREKGQKKKYVQSLIEEEKDVVVDALVRRKGYLYICGDAKHMAREVEATLESIIGDSIGGGAAEGARELKTLKERKRVSLDVWS